MREPITYKELKISTFELLYIKKFNVIAEINEHSTLKLVGILPEDRKDQDIHTDYNTPIQVYSLSNNEKKVIYNGIITEIRVKKSSNYYEIYIEAQGYTYLMDIKKRKRSFQDKTMSIHKLINEITNSYNKGDSIVNLPDEPIDKLYVQYNETDWEFIKRVASYYNAGLFSDIILEGVHYFVDTPELNNKNIEVNEFVATKLIKDYDVIKENQLPNSNEIDYITYKIKSYEILQLGEHISFKNQSFYVSNLSYEISDGLLENTYVLQPKGGQKQRRLYGEKLRGISLEGSVIEVNGDKIKVKLDIDGKQDKSTAYWFKYSTLAASQDGSGWYFMPEINDRVRIYFPSDDEKDAFAISCIQQIKGNPDTKYISTIYNKKLIFTKDSVTITADNNATIVLNKNGGVSISGGNVSLNASEKITLRAEDSIIISGKNNVDISCDKGGKTLLQGSGNIELNGTKIRIN